MLKCAELGIVELAASSLLIPTRAGIEWRRRRPPRAQYQPFGAAVCAIFANLSSQSLASLSLSLAIGFILNDAAAAAASTAFEATARKSSTSALERSTDGFESWLLLECEQQPRLAKRANCGVSQHCSRESAVGESVHRRNTAPPPLQCNARLVWPVSQPRRRQCKAAFVHLAIGANGCQ